MQPDGGSRRHAPSWADEADAVADEISDRVAQLAPAARLRLVAFLHLLEYPEHASAVIELNEAAGLIRLTLACPMEPGAGALT